MKKIITLTMAISLIFSLSACGGSSQGESSGRTETTRQTEQQAEENSTADIRQSETGNTDSAGGNKVLVAYFAYNENIGDTSAMDVDAITSASLNAHTDNELGNLQVMAQEAATVKDADLFSIQITDPYDPDYETMVGIAKDDQGNGKQFSFVSEIENFEDYDTFYIGTPVWWGKLPQPMVSFFESYDFSGKTIIPFGIHLGSRFGSMVDQMKELEPDANILDGFTVSADTENSNVRSEFDEFLNSSK